MYILLYYYSRKNLNNKENKQVKKESMAQHKQKVQG